MIIFAGNNSDKDRSDCFVSFEPLESGGLTIKIESKVQTNYGKSIYKLANDILQFFEIHHANLFISDKGALPFVIAARIEAAIKNIIATPKEYLLPVLGENIKPTTRDLRRTSRLFLPGNKPSMMINAGIFSPDGIILDLEDSVAFSKKSEARLLVRNALRNHSFLGAERMVRINQIPAGLDDLTLIIPQSPNVVVIPKCENPEQIKFVNETIKTIQKRCEINNPVWIIPVIESAMGVMKAMELAFAADNIVAMVIGLEDYTADIGAQRTTEGLESFFARSVMLNACKAAGIQALDSVFSDIEDLTTLKETALRSKSMGFDGMGCIHPRQIETVHECFAPTMPEIEQARKIIAAYDKAKEQGLGVVSLGSKMIDLPVLKRAQRTLDLASAFKKLDTNRNRQA